MTATVTLISGAENRACMDRWRHGGNAAPVRPGLACPAKLLPITHDGIPTDDEVAQPSAPFLLRLALRVVRALLRFRAASAEARTGYEYYQIGDLRAPRTGTTEPALMLMGGGKWPHKAFAWFAAKGGHGHFVILRASGAEEMQQELYTEVGGVASVQTLVFNSRDAASDPAVLDIVRHADGIFIAGGDQANYVRFWKGTPLNAVLNEHVADGKPIGGTSAGLAILGEYGYGAMDGGSIESKDALRDPLGEAMTLVGDFMHLPNMQHVITDTHFNIRDRLGRLIAFVANLRHAGKADMIGLGVDQDAALCVDGARHRPTLHDQQWLRLAGAAAGRTGPDRAGQTSGVPGHAHHRNRHAESHRHAWVRGHAPRLRGRRRRARRRAEGPWHAIAGAGNPWRRRGGARRHDAAD